jgi:hypothetical protein
MPLFNTEVVKAETNILPLVWCGNKGEDCDRILLDQQEIENMSKGTARKR